MKVATFTAWAQDHSPPQSAEMKSPACMPFGREPKRRSIERKSERGGQPCSSIFSKLSFLGGESRWAIWKRLVTDSIERTRFVDRDERAKYVDRPKDAGGLMGPDMDV